MPAVSRLIICDYPHEFLYKIILDIEKYPEFVPWCVDAKIITASSNKIEADLKGAFKGFSYTYRSLVNFDYNKNESSVAAQMIAGPFKFLHTKWQLKYLDESRVQVKFDIEFEFHSFILEKIAKLSINKFTDEIMKAFLIRASKLYDQKANID